VRCSIRVLAKAFVFARTGNLLALPQTNVKLLLGFSGVAQIGYMLMAFASDSAEALGMLLFYAVGYTFTNMGAFLVVQAAAAAGGDDRIDSFDGLAERSPGLALSMLVFLLSLAGIPFVVGFWGKLYVFIAAWHAGFGWLVVIGAVLAVVALFYYLQIARAMYINPALARSFPLRPASRSPSRSASRLLSAWALGPIPSPWRPATQRATSSPSPMRVLDTSTKPYRPIGKNAR
jgi:NADH-quinone oxidoreductase subunit N